MSSWFWLPMLVLLAMMQTSLVPGLQVGPAAPQLVLVWVVCWAVIRGRGAALPWAIAGGLILDLLSQMPPGAHLLALTAVTYLADLGHRVMQGSTALFAGAAVFAGSLLYGLILLGALALVGRHPDIATATVLGVMPGALYNLAVLVPVFLLLRGLDRRFPVSVLPAW
ncbi:MAG: rod shape-determining protein MreD [Candidatus Dormibacteraeota bacterium]|nr:rod shape-determining protein MreD [Candidatus Dormibacteraeota bacterium]